MLGPFGTGRLLRPDLRLAILIRDPLQQLPMEEEVLYQHPIVSKCVRESALQRRSESRWYLARLARAVRGLDHHLDLVDFDDGFLSVSAEAVPGGLARTKISRRKGPAKLMSLRDDLTLDLDAQSKDRPCRDPAVDSASVVPDLEPFPLNCLDKMKIFAPVDFTENDIAHAQRGRIDRLDCLATIRIPHPPTIGIPSF